MAGHPNNVIMLTSDAYGVLPPISKLTPEQARYHFLSGYTAKVAGTERGVVEPRATFSACFGAPFMAQPPTVYSRLLGEKVAAHDVRCWLVNTGWTGGPYGDGHRMPIQHTRAMVNAALEGRRSAARTGSGPRPATSASARRAVSTWTGGRRPGARRGSGGRRGRPSMG